MKSQHGMTLIEVLVALVLLSMLSVGLFSAFRVGQRSYNQLVRNNVAAQDLLATQRLLRHVIESAYPLRTQVLQPHYGMEGDPDELKLTAAAPGNSNSGHYRYRVFTVLRADGLKDLVVAYGVDRNGVMLVNTNGAMNGSSSEVLLSGIQDVVFSYLPSVTESAGIRISPSAEWLTRWQQQAQLPALVKVQVQFAPDDRRRWPVLIAAPKVTDDMQCEFDVVSQSCRGASS